MLRLVLAFALALSCIAPPVSGQEQPKTPPATPAAPGTRVPGGGALGSAHIVGSVLVGERAPDFSLSAANGGAYRLKSARGKWVALFFADRREDLDGIAVHAAVLDTLGFTSIVVCNEKVSALAKWSRATTTSLVALADEHGEISAIYGLWDVEHAMIRPGLFVLDPQGEVKLALLGQKVAPPSLRGLVQSAKEGF